LAVVSVLASLDILVTVLLARIVLAERLRRLQSAGVVLSVVGVVLISAG
jgi:drug/metabolite transporter (DMT)-like permease